MLALNIKSRGGGAGTMLVGDVRRGEIQNKARAGQTRGQLGETAGG